MNATKENKCQMIVRSPVRAVCGKPAKYVVNGYRLCGVHTGPANRTEANRIGK